MAGNWHSTRVDAQRHDSVIDATSTITVIDATASTDVIHYDFVETSIGTIVVGVGDGRIAEILIAQRPGLRRFDLVAEAASARDV